jgi:hypothetical protein
MFNVQLLSPPLGFLGGGGGEDDPGLVVPLCDSGEGVSVSLNSASIRSRARNTFDWR